MFWKKSTQTPRWLWVVMVAALFALAGCLSPNGDDGPVETGRIVIHWPYAVPDEGEGEGDEPDENNVRPFALSGPIESQVGSLRVALFTLEGAIVQGAQGEVTAVNQTATITVPVGNDYIVGVIAVIDHLLSHPIGPVILGSGYVSGVVVVANTTTTVPVPLLDVVLDVTASPASGPNFEFGEKPVVTFAVSADFPANIAPSSVGIYAVDPGYAINLTTPFIPLLCTLAFPGNTCTVGDPGLGADFGAESSYTSPKNFKFRTLLDVSGYAMPSVSGNPASAPTIWPQDSGEPATTSIEVLSSATYTVNPSATGSVDVIFQ